MMIGCLYNRNLLQVFHLNNTCTQRQKLIDRYLYGSVVLVYIFDHSIVPDNASKQRSENIDKKQRFYISQIRFSDLIEFCYIKESIRSNRCNIFKINLDAMVFSIDSKSSEWSKLFQLYM